MDPSSVTGIRIRVTCDRCFGRLVADKCEFTCPNCFKALDVSSWIDDFRRGDGITLAQAAEIGMQNSAISLKAAVRHGRKGGASVCGQYHIVDGEVSAGQYCIFCAQNL